MIAGLYAQALAGNIASIEGIKALIFTSTGLSLETLDAEGAKKAIGQKLADDLNEYYGTSFTSLYPLENLGEQVKNQLLSEVLNAVSGSSVVGKLMTNTVATDFANQVINRYRVIHNLPALGVGVILPSTAERVKNKAQQATFRASHERLAYWKNNSNDAIFDAFKYKLNACRIAKRNSDKAFSLWQKALNNGSSTAAALETIYNTKHAIALAAQSLNYTGDGTTL